MRLADLRERLDGTLQGDGQLEIQKVASLEDARENDISFLTDPRYATQAETSKAGAILVPMDCSLEGKRNLLRVEDVGKALDEILTLFAPPRETPPPGAHPSACISAEAVIEDGVAIGPFVTIGPGTHIHKGCSFGPGCVVGRDVEIGEDCRFDSHVVIEDGCRLGKRVVVHSNSTLGSDGFGYRTANGKHEKVPQIGIVVIEDDVEIGANSCIDRAKCGQTRIGKGTKIDNLVQIGHNVRTGPHCIVCAQSGISGSTILGKYVVLGGQCGLVGHLQIGDGVQGGAQAGITGSVEAGEKVVGFPARSIKQFYRELAQVKKLGNLMKEVKKLRCEIDTGARSEEKIG